MTRNELIKKIMKLDFTVFGTNLIPTLGNIKSLSDAELATILSKYDEIKNAQYKVQSILIKKI